MMLNVKLLTYTPNPEQVVALAAKLCYTSSSINELMEKMSDEDQTMFLKTIISNRHLSVLEHAVFTFGIEGISRACSHQLVRHRIASYSQQSQRYVKIENFKFITPPRISEDSMLNELYNNCMKSIGNMYLHLNNLLQSKIDDLSKEDARFILPNATETKIIVTMNARQLLHFFEVRCCRRAQWEIRNLAYRMLELVREVAPTIFENAGPPCVSIGKCFEGKRSCQNKNKQQNKRRK